MLNVTITHGTMARTELDVQYKRAIERKLVTARHNYRFCLRRTDYMHVVKLVVRRPDIVWEAAVVHKWGNLEPAGWTAGPRIKLHCIGHKHSRFKHTVSFQPEISSLPVGLFSLSLSLLLVFDNYWYLGLMYLDFSPLCVSTIHTSSEYFHRVSHFYTACRLQIADWGISLQCVS